jgi:rhodanese-related sulfurtransferase
MKFSLKSILVFGFALATSAACLAFCFSYQSDFDAMVKGQLKGTVPLMSVDELKKNTESAKDIYVLDAREYAEFKVSHIYGAKPVGYENFSSFLVSGLDKSKTVVVYCSIGVRSERIGEQLLSLGFSKVYNLFGGVFKWVNQGFPLVDQNGKLTSHVHPYNRRWGKWLTKGVQDYGK